MSARITLSMFSCWTMALFSLTLLPPVWAATPDVGLVTDLSGEVTYWHPAEKQGPAKAQAFLKIREGDHFRVAGGGLVQLTFFVSGRQETWKGPATLEVGDQASRPAANEPPPSTPHVKVLTTKVTKRLGGTPLVATRPEAQPKGISRESGSAVRSAGVIRTMAPKQAPAPPLPPRPLSEQDNKEVADAEKIYQDLKKQARPGDLTPEIYLLSVYSEYGQYSKMERVIDAMLTQRPEDANLKKLKAWAQSQVSGKE